MKLILIGIQGAGKSTQGNILSKKLGLPYLSTGHIFRTIAMEKTPMGRYIKEVMNAGFLIPDEKTLEVVSEYLSRPEYEKGYIVEEKIACRPLLCEQHNVYNCKNGCIIESMEEYVLYISESTLDP